MQINLVLLVVVCIPALTEQESVTPVAFSESRESVTAFSSSGKLNLPAVHIQLDLAYGRGKRERRDVSIVYDPNNGHYLWHLATFPASARAGHFLDGVKSKQEALYVDQDGLYDFVLKADLWVKVYKSRAGSLEVAERAAINEVQQALGSIERYQPRTGPTLPSWPWDYRPVDLGTAIAGDFSCAPLRANCPDDRNAIISIGKQGANWRLVLRNRWDLEIGLDSSFNLVSARRIESPKQER